VLVPGLVSSGMSLPNAISAMLIYRLISWLLIAAIGWVIFFFLFRTQNGADVEEADDGGGPESSTTSAEPPTTSPADTALQGPLPPPEPGSPSSNR